MDHIVLNSLELELADVVLRSESGESVPVDGVELDPKEEKATFRLSAKIQPGLYQLGMGFKGAIIDKLKGFYCSKYTRWVPTALESFSNQ